MAAHHLVVALALVIPVSAIAACSSSAPPANTAGVTSKQQTDTQDAVWRLAGAKCKHAAACNEVGGNRNYASTDACMSENRGKLQDDLRASNCPHGVNSDRLQSCLSEIESEACSGIGSGFNRSMACKSGQLCP